MAEFFRAAPAFWRAGTHSPWPVLLAPLGGITAWLTRRRVGQPGWRAPVPVLCCGNVTAGGAGKTTVALDLGQRWQARGVAVHFLSRGHGGRVREVLRVDPARHDAALVGDEPLLLAEVAPTWVGPDRAAAARAAIAAGAQALLMDDGLQHPTLCKDTSLLVIDGRTGFGNRRLIPAGPLRETVAAGAARCAAAVLIGEDATGALADLPAGLPVLHARLVPTGAEQVTGRRVLAFAGIAHPDKFFATLVEAAAELVGQSPFPDHFRYNDATLRALLGRAEQMHALAVTTPKDAVRLPSWARRQVTVVGVRLEWDRGCALSALFPEFRSYTSRRGD
jgi:tetraacyldisaccharide 4'-kinase